MNHLPQIRGCSPLYAEEGNFGRFPVTLVGYGRYGNYIGPKYAKSGCPWRMAAVLDPALTPEGFKQTVLGKLKPDTLVFRSFDNWRDAYFLQLSEAEKAQVVVELALPADTVYKVAKQFLEIGVKQIILPKPVVDTEADLHGLVQATLSHRAKVAVASQWYYSSIPKMIQRDLKRLAGNKNNHLLDLDKVIITFSKENGHAIAPAPLCEYPHLLQILHSAGLMADSQRTGVDGTDYALNVHYAAPGIRHGITGIAEMDYERTPAQRDRFPQWDYQERTLYAWGTDRSDLPLLWVDFWIKFSTSGDSVIYTGRYSTREPDGTVLSHGIAEDLLMQMHEAIYKSFDNPFDVFESDPLVLPLTRYQDIGLEIVRVHDMWERHSEPLTGTRG